MPRPDKGKTKTIKQRAIYIYLPSLEMAEDWKQKAEKAGTSISKFAIERVEDSIRREEGEEGYLTRLNLLKRLSSSEEEAKKLIKENRLLKKLVDNLDNELRRYRAQPFLQQNYEGVRRFDKELVSLLKDGESYSDEAILSRLSIDQSDTDLIKAVTKQLEILEAYDLIAFDGRSWRWKQ